MKRNTSNWSNFCILLRRAGLSASAGLSCSYHAHYCAHEPSLVTKVLRSARVHPAKME